MSQEPTSIVQDAPAPFSSDPDPEDNVPAPDFILRSGDGVDLHVHKAILRFVTVFFKNMLDGAGVGDLERDGKPVVILSEPCAVLHRLLCIANPGRSLEHYSLAAQNLDGVWAVHKAANKYLFIAFAIARLRNLPDLGRKAALSTLYFPVCPANLTFPELELLLAATFQQLHEFHHACGKAAERIVRRNGDSMDYTNPDTRITMAEDDHYEFVWWKTSNDDRDYHAPACDPYIRVDHHDGSIDISPSQWFKNHIDVLAPKLRAHPTRHTVEKEACSLADADRNMTKDCHECLQHAEHDLIDFREQLGRQIEMSNNELAAAL
ncbi:hypothetical protein B0H10DRAFT_2211236 [Mycena sp. CBHHK59/15]|nr:hypothetical protein B0H10DRAFT_2211236 [Mycena sp. CBHHK59/15]